MTDMIYISIGIGIGAVLGVGLFILIKWLRSRKEEEEYEPTGKVGYRTFSSNTFYKFTLIVEQIDKIESKVKIKILEVDINRDCKENRDACLKHWGKGDWVYEKDFTWTKKSAGEIRQEKIDSIIGNDGNNP